MKYLWRTLGFLWMIPNTAVGYVIFYLLNLIMWIEPIEVDWRGLGLPLRVTGPIARWMQRRNWYAHTVGFFMFFYVEPTERQLAHEETHVVQQMLLGVFQPILYAVFFVVGLVRYRNLFLAYDQNPFERAARRKAGEDV